MLSGFNDEGPGSDKARDLGVSKFIQETPDIAIDGFAPHLLARPEIARYDDRFDSRVERAGIERHEPALAVPQNAQRSFSFT